MKFLAVYLALAKGFLLGILVLFIGTKSGFGQDKQSTCSERLGFLCSRLLAFISNKIMARNPDQF